MNKRVVTVSASYMCLKTNMNNLPGGAQELDGNSYSYTPGGRGITAALTFAAFGLDSIYCSAIGDDRHGKVLDSFLRRAGIDCRFVKTVPRVRSGLKLTLIEEGKTERTVKFPEANRYIEDGDIEEAFATYPDALFLQRELPPELMISAAKHAARGKVPIIWQPCEKHGAIDEKELGPLEILILDADEVASYCGIEMTEYDKFLPAAMALAERIPAKYHVIRIPDRGTFIYDGMYHHMVGEYPSTYIDETGSREIYGAVLAAAYLKSGGEIKTAAQCASLAYAVSSSERGEVSSVPTEEDLAKYLKRRQNSRY